MPLYDYHCKACDETFELLVRSDTRLVCPKCGSEDLEKLVSLTAPQGKTKQIIQRARAQANKEGHFSNFSKSEKPKF